MPSFKVKFSGVTILQGVEFSIFPIDFEWALQQCSATALPVISGQLPAPTVNGGGDLKMAVFPTLKGS